MTTKKKKRRIGRRYLMRRPLPGPRPHVYVEIEGVQVNGATDGRLSVAFVAARPPSESPRARRPGEGWPLEEQDCVRLQLDGPNHTKLVALVSLDDFEQLVAPVLVAPDAANMSRAARFP